jgi:hypothetical protein
VSGRSVAAAARRVFDAFAKRTHGRPRPGYGPGAASPDAIALARRGRKPAGLRLWLSFSCSSLQCGALWYGWLVANLGAGTGVAMVPCITIHRGTDGRTLAGMHLRRKAATPVRGGRRARSRSTGSNKAPLLPPKLRCVNSKRAKVCLVA